MSFSASTCLSYTGTTTLTEPISIYTFSDVFITAVTLNQITDCPLVLTGIPDGTTTIKIKSANFYCCDVPLTCNDLCTTCDLDFDLYQTNLISRIVAGNLTGSCDSSITDYKINWYRSPDLTTPVFTSGYGTAFIPYNLTHPLSGASSPLVIAGTYTPVIEKINVNGLNYSTTGGTGFIQANLGCFNSTTVEVAPFTCSNGTELGDYTHRVQFSGASAGLTPLTLTSTFSLSSTTNYFAWKFRGFDIPDSLKITFYGTSYPVPIVLEYYTVGNNLTSNNLLPTTYHKSAITSGNFSFLSKVTSFENIIVNDGDFLLLEVTPNPDNSNTNWDFYFTCLETFDCSLPCLYDYLNTPYKISLSTLTYSANSCNLLFIRFSVSGCSTNDVSGSDVYKYMQSSISGWQTTLFDGTSILTDNTTNLYSGWKAGLPFRLGNTNECGQSCTGSSVGTCVTPNSNTISFQKSNTGPFGQGVIDMVFSDLSDLSAYYNAILPNLGMVLPNTDIGYYKTVKVRLPKPPLPSSNCGDSTIPVEYSFHSSSVMTSGGTPGNYTLNITMPTMSNGMSFTVCQFNCPGSVNNMVNNINNASTGSTNVDSFTSTTGSRFTQSTIIQNCRVNLNTTSVTADTAQGLWYFGYDLNKTIPFSGSGISYVPIPSLSANTCNISGIGRTLQVPGGPMYADVFAYTYKIVLPDPNDTTTFSILADPIINGVRSAFYTDTAITVVGNVITYANPAYTF